MNEARTSQIFYVVLEMFCGKFSYRYRESENSSNGSIKGSVRTVNRLKGKDKDALAKLLRESLDRPLLLDYRGAR